MKLSMRTTFYNARYKSLKVNRGRHARTMTLHAIDHLQMDHYKARTAEVHDLADGKLHAVITRTLYKVETIFERNPLNYDMPERKEKK